MFNKIGLPLLFAVISLSSCFDISDKVSIEKNGSGVYHRTMDYSKSVDGMKAMAGGNDTAMQKFVHSLDSSTRAMYEKISNTPGITPVEFRSSDSGAVFNLSFKFASVAALNTAFNKILEEGNGVNPKGFFTFKKGKLGYLGGVPGVVNPTGKALDEETLNMMKGMMGESSYNIEIETPGTVKKCSNKSWTSSTNTVKFSEKLTGLFENPVKSKTDISFK